MPVGIEDVVQVVERGSKEGVDQIPELIKRKTETLEFRLGHGDCRGPVIQEYFESLDAYAYLRYAIVYYRDGTLFGIFNARDLLRYLRDRSDAYRDFAEYLNNADEDSLQALCDLPGFISGEYRVTATSNKRFRLAADDRTK